MKVVTTNTSESSNTNNINNILSIKSVIEYSNCTFETDLCRVVFKKVKKIKSDSNSETRKFHVLCGIRETRLGLD